MGKSNPNRSWYNIVLMFAVFFVASCQKQSNTKAKQGTDSGPFTISLIENGNNNAKKLLIPVTRVGDESISYNCIFDTGSVGMTIDATGVLPASMITASGITVPLDSVYINGITVTHLQSVVRVPIDTNIVTEYGNLAYAPVTIGGADGSITIKKMYFFIYYKAVSHAGTVLPTHSGDVFGIGPGLNHDLTAMASPLSYYTFGSDITSGFKLSNLRGAAFTPSDISVPGLLTVGLTKSDISSGSGFVMHELGSDLHGLISPNINSIVLPNNTGRFVSTGILFDTGVSETIIEDPHAANGDLGQLADGTIVNFNTSQNFTYQYSASINTNITFMKNPNTTGDARTIYGLDFFINNEFLVDYAHNKIGLKLN